MNQIHLRNLFRILETAAAFYSFQHDCRRYAVITFYSMLNVLELIGFARVAVRFLVIRAYYEFRMGFADSFAHRGV